MRRAKFAAWSLAGLLAVTAITSTRVVRAEDAVSDEARRHFKAGVALLLDPDGERVEEAYREFKEAYALSHSPKILGNLGLCAMKLERDGEAIDAYTTYLHEMQDLDPNERDQVVRDLQTLTVGVTRVTIAVEVAADPASAAAAPAPASAAPPSTPTSSSPAPAPTPGAASAAPAEGDPSRAAAFAATQIVDVRVPNRGERVTNIYGPVQGKIELGIRPGHHEMTVKLAGYQTQTWEFEAHGGGRESHAFKLVKREAAASGIALSSTASADTRGSNVLPWVVAGVGGAMLVTGAVTGVMALGKVKDIENRCPNDLCPSSYDLAPDRSTVKTLSTVTDVMLIGGAVIAAGGVTWALLSNRSSESVTASVTASRSPSTPRLSAASAACTASGCAGTLRFQF